LADEKGMVPTASDKPSPVAGKVLYGGDKLTPREARVLAAQGSFKPKARKLPKKPAGA
jgi:hypothetical protein